MTLWVAANRSYLKRFAMNVGFIISHPDSLQCTGNDAPVDSGALKGHVKIHYSFSFCRPVPVARFSPFSAALTNFRLSLEVDGPRRSDAAHDPRRHFSEPLPGS